MKHGLIAVLVLGLAVPAFAILGLPVADDALSEAGRIEAGAGVTLESDVNLYGARVAYGVNDDISLFAGGGIIDLDGLDNEPYLQLGAKYRLPVADLPFDLALRAAFGITSFEESWRDPWGSYKIEIDLWTLNAGVLASKQIDQITVYGLLGLSYWKTEVTGTARGAGESFRISESDTDTELAVAGGAMFAVNEQLSLYGELAHIDELFISLGAKYRF